jgi:hypothetical protein
VGARHVLLTGAVLIALAGCGSSAPPAAPNGPPPGGPPPGGPPPGGPPPGGRLPGGPPPPPDRATAEAYVADLRRIDPAIVGDGDLRRLVDQGRDQCVAIRESPGDRARLIDLTNRRFTAPDHPAGFGADKAAAILDVVRERICPATG